MQEAKEITASVELDSIFAESQNLSEETKAEFKTVFEEAVKKHAIALAESHINAIAEKADALVESTVETKMTEHDETLTKMIESYLDHIAKEWLSENIMEVHKGIKSDLFESMFVELKRVFVEHNVTIPDESVDIVAEMEDELAESKSEITSLFTQLTESKKELNTLNKERLTEAKVKNLTESQKEKVYSLVEEIEYNDKYEGKLDAIVKMAESKKLEEAVKQTQEPKQTQELTEAEKLNFGNSNTQEQNTNANMAQYLKY